MVRGLRNYPPRANSGAFSNQHVKQHRAIMSVSREMTGPAMFQAQRLVMALTVS